MAFKAATSRTQCHSLSIHFLWNLSAEVAIAWEQHNSCMWNFELVHTYVHVQANYTTQESLKIFSFCRCRVCWRQPEWQKTFAFCCRLSLPVCRPHYIYYSPKQCYYDEKKNNNYLVRRNSKLWLNWVGINVERLFYVQGLPRLTSTYSPLGLWVYKGQRVVFMFIQASCQHIQIPCGTFKPLLHQTSKLSQRLKSAPSRPASNWIHTPQPGWLIALCSDSSSTQHIV